MALVEIRDVDKSFKREAQTVDVYSGLTIDFEEGSYTALMGPQGLREVAELSVSKAHYLAERLDEAGLKLRYPDAPFLWEFAVEVPDVALANEALLREGMLGGLDLGDGAMLVAVTEKRTREELDAFVEVVADAV